MVDIILAITLIIVPIYIAIRVFEESNKKDPEYEEWKRNNPD